MATVLLMRHGRTTANTAGILAGWTQGVDLDDTGCDQARAWSTLLAAIPLTLAVTSPLLRCCHTADLALAGQDIPRRTDDRLGECRYGAWTGRHLADLADDPLWRTVQDQPAAARFPDSPTSSGESLADMSARSVAAIREIDTDITTTYGDDAIWLAVTHGDVIKAILADAAGAHLDLFQRWQIDPGSLSIVRYTPTRPYLLRVNDTSSPWQPPRQRTTTDAVPGGGAGD
ncbi:2,3-bisphosphoglycerate-dependent phosphoglycerate mutase [Austwickia sp. TVS 96-490-7B]|uniref:MSMEG_4193 family putative phosphomutase n=1 Tax=Austwickia sp. TVS 96-490-7B TaxID=2830843 RepID=UPI001C575924|nr:MSMEG_4193 family putative phosphomutase [Austwickia sp. TVS 96-490-7B]MBW3086249.1 2,3-bisphosphoglycerate-dependent phosphoglycerate mutase [Austwickia sp. TVS 96-490-7B]